MTDLRALLGDKYDDVMFRAMSAVASQPHGKPYTMLERVADTLAAVLPDLLADAWDEGKHSEHTPACRLGDGNCTCPNPYQPEGETHE